MEPAPRHVARERALGLLYEAAVKGCPPGEVLAGLAVPTDPYAAFLVRRAEELESQADELIAAAAVAWPLERMALLDRLVMRLAVTELLDAEGPPVPVVLDEAVELAKAYSTEDSGRFVNGVLSAIARRLGEGATGGPPEGS